MGRYAAHGFFYARKYPAQRYILSSVFHLECMLILFNIFGWNPELDQYEIITTHAPLFCALLVD